MTLNIRIVTSKGIVWDGTAQSVVLPCSDGEMGILQGHLPLTTSLNIGILRVRVDWRWLIFFVEEGFAQVEGDEIAVLVNDAEWSDRIDIQLAQTELETAAVSLKQSRTRGEKFLAAKALKVAQTRLKAAQEFSTSRQRLIF
ncbi:ATP synthase F1 subunit epsilon [Pleurocapsales cyanobacterium LEGE 10410]|nr:ATP synthase F1 subunit epsilon [Pleurocapsales cyanobacterium LEGE 10410]